MREVYKKYNISKKLAGIDTQLDPDKCSIQEFMKDIDKNQTFEKSYRDKVGQSIKAWKVELNGAFCTYARTEEGWFKKNLNNHTIFANGLNDDELRARMDQIPEKNASFETDCTEFDLNQTLLTQAAERAILEIFDKSDAVKLYYFMRHKARVHASFGSYWNEIVKTSGEPMTLFMNTILTMVLICLVIKPSNYSGAPFKGDDSCVFLKEAITKFEGLFVEAQKFMDVEFKYATGPIPEFCSMLYLKDTLLFYDYVKLAQKILSRQYKGVTEQARMELFAEYQTAVKDKLKPYASDPGAVISTLCYKYGMHSDRVSVLMEQLIAFSKMSWHELKQDLEEKQSPLFQ